eukprot:scaffold17639_cov30-Tisochrysis_lutea.AAC.4
MEAKGWMAHAMKATRATSATFLKLGGMDYVHKHNAPALRIATDKTPSSMATRRRSGPTCTTTCCLHTSSIALPTRLSPSQDTRWIR